METIAPAARVPLTYHTLEVDLRELRRSLYGGAHPMTSTPSLSCRLANCDANVAMVGGPPHTTANMRATQ